MTRGVSAPALGWLVLGLRRLALSLLAAVLVALVAATLLVGAWLVLDPERALSDAPYAWLGMFMVTLAFGSPSAVMFGLVVAPLAALAGRAHAGWRLLTCLAGGGVLVLLTTNLRFAVLGVLGGLVYAVLEGQLTRWQARRGSGEHGKPG